MKRLYALLMCGLSASAAAGPGSSGGNPSTINGLAKGYALTSPYPDKVASTRETDTFDFRLRGYRLAVTRLPSAAACMAAGVFRRVCIVVDEPMLKRGQVSFATGESFEVETTSLGAGPVEMDVVFQRAAAELILTSKEDAQ